MNAKKYLKLILLFFFVLTFKQISAQLSKVHFIPPLTSAENGNANPETQYIYISTPNSNVINYTIKPIGEPSTNYIIGQVSNSTPAEISLGSGNTHLFVPASQTSSVINNKGYIIEAEDVIYASIRMNAGSSAQAGALVSKGMSALGTVFRVGSYTNENPQDNYLNFVSVMATEDNTSIVFDDLPTGIILKNYTGGLPINTTLNKGESYTLATNSFDSTINRDGLIGTLVQSDKPIVVNCGSANGSFHNGGGRDYGIDQIVGFSKVGNEYIFVKGNGENGWENILIVAHLDNTAIYINGDANAATTINAGEYYLIEGHNYSSNGNMYVQTSNNVFAYQGVGATTNEANQGLFFVPPLSCENRGNLDNIANIGEIGTTQYTGGLSIVTKTGATVLINNVSITNYSTNGPNTITGNNDYVTYKVTGLSGNVSVQSTDELYCAYFNFNGAATSGSFYSGFPSAPEVNFKAAFETLGNCIPNITLSAANMDNFDSLEWYFNDGSGFVPTGNSSITYTPTLPGNYKLIGIINCSNLQLESQEVPVSICPDDTDNDGIIDNIDIDNDNDGILNCIESYGNQTIDITNLNNGSLPVGNFNYTGTITTNGNAVSTPFIGSNDGTFMSEVPIKNSSLETSASYKLNFNNNLNLQLIYATSNILGNGILTNDEEFTIQVPNNKTITLINPDNQLLVDTDYDGVYENNITQFSSFEIRFKLASNSLPIGSGTFKFKASLIDSFTITHKNNSETNSNQATFQISATCVPIDHDNDSVIDSFDLDSDNDGIPDSIESKGINYLPLSNIDDDLNGLDDIYDSNAISIDTDNDGVQDYLDLDSDNDGIFDLEETGNLGSYLSDTDLNGVVDWQSSTDMNGLVDSAETFPDSGVIAYVLNDIDADLYFNYIDLDSDGDGCSDVIEAGFSDANNDNFIGDTSVLVNTLGVVTNASDGYTWPINANYSIAAPISIIQQPSNTVVCTESDILITIETSTIDTIQWQESTDGINWSNITNNTFYNGVNTAQLLISNTPISYNNNKYRARLDKNGNSCGLISAIAILTVNPLPIVASTVTLKQCDNDTDGKSLFNLTEANTKISLNAIHENFTYFLTSVAATIGDITSTNYISNPTNFENRTVNTDVIWARIESQFGCASISEIELIVSTTGIPATFQRSYTVCDDFLDENGNNTVNNNDRDGITTFNFSTINNEVIAIFPAGQQLIINYYRNENDALAEENEILDISNYRNIGYPHSQQIYIRVDSEIDNDCLGFGTHITLNVEKLPIANPVTIERQCDDNQDGMFPFDISLIEQNILNGQSLSNVSVSYFDENNNQLPSPLPNPFLTTSQTITIRVTNNTTNANNGPCFDETTLTFIVDKAPIANQVTIIPACDDISNDGIYDFDTSAIQTTILGSQTGMEVHYFNELGVELPSPLPNPFSTYTQTVTAIVINPINTTCIASTSFNFIVNSLPNFNIETPRIICLTEPTSILTLDVSQEDNSELLDYQWTDETGLILSANEFLEVSLPGIYFITLTKTNGSGCSRTKEINVNPSEIATINLEDITIEDDSDNNTITISTINLGIGDYEFSLDNKYYAYQDEPYFENVKAGIHTIYVRDKNNCGIAQVEVSVIGFPKFFTPNNDGHNDTWKVLGVNENLYTSATIYIFDRFGKLITQINPKSEGWDGLLNGKHLSSSDYWFNVQLIDLNGNIRVRKGHFSLIRK